MRGNLFQNFFYYFITRYRVQRFIQSLTNVRFHANVNWPHIEKIFKLIRPVETNFPLTRIGPNGDGGYLIANDLDGVEACFSPGVSTIADFELSLANSGIPCFLADYSVEASPVEHPLIEFQKKFLGPETQDHFISLSDWIDEKCPHGQNMILQMDIEGAEIAVLLSTPRSVLRRFRHMVIEFHYLEHILDPAGRYMFDLIFDKLHQDFEVVHIHPNNHSSPFKINGIEIPLFIELSFLRRDRISHMKPVTGPYPHKLDRPNLNDRPDVILHPVWYDRNFKFPNL